MSTDYTDIVARFVDNFAAETLANYIASQGISCDVVENPTFQARYAIRVRSDQLAELRQVLDLQPVSSALTYEAAHIIAARLARENLPCYVGGGHYAAVPFFGNLDVPIKETTKSGFTVFVPAKLGKAALRVLEVTPISEADLTKLALADDPDSKDPP